jgi:selT/selW/selH-like putative selenoprotein
VADLMKKECNIDAELIKGGGGIFDIKLDGKLVYSKNQTGFFPSDDDIRNLFKK